MDVLFADDDLNGADQAGLQPGVLHHLAHHIGGGGLALGAGDSDGGQLLGGVAEPGGAQLCQSQTAVGHLQHGDVGGHLHIMLNDHNGSPLGGHVGQIAVAVADGAHYADKDAARLHLAGVIYQCGNILFQSALHQRVVQALHQIHQSFHPLISPSNTVVAGPVI